MRNACIGARQRHHALVGRIQTSKGAIGYAEAGAGETPIVFLHGVGSDKSVWRPQLEHFCRSRRAIAFDYPGYGESDPAPPAVTRDDFAAAIFAAMDALEIERAHVCGLSLGGVVAIAMHHAAPGRCASLIIADSFAAHPDGPAIRERGLNASRSIGMRAMAEQRVGILLAPGASAELRDEVIEAMAGIEPQAFAVGLDAVWLADQRERAAAIDVPTLVLCGDRDAVTPPALSDELAELIRGAQSRLIEGAGHLSNAEQPAAFNGLVGEFIQQAEAET